MASGIQARIGAQPAAAFDINTACTSFLYGLSTATALIRTGVVRNALVIGAELISPFMDWSNRDVAVLFGDGAAAVVLEASTREEGVLAEKLGCFGEAREILRVQGMGGRYANHGVLYGIVRWQFEGQEIFKRAVAGMSSACEASLARLGLKASDVDLVVPHQANLRIIEAVARRAQVPMERVFVNIQRYGNMSAATVAIALCEAVEEGRVRPGSLLLLPGFGGGLSYSAHVVRWGERTQPLQTSARAAAAERAHRARTHPRLPAAQEHPGRSAARSRSRASNERSRNIPRGVPSLVAPSFRRYQPLSP